MVRRALHPLSERARIVHGPRTVADGLLAGLRRVGGDCRDRLSAGVRIHLTGVPIYPFSAPAFATVALAATQVVHQPRAPCTSERQLWNSTSRTAPLFTAVRGRGILRNPFAGSCIAPIIW